MAAARQRRWIFIALGVVAVALFLFGVLHKKKQPPQHAPVVSVAVAQVTAQDVPVAITALGAAQAWRSNTIVAQVSGQLLSVNFNEGAAVRRGQLLAQIDAAPYRAALAQAQGSLRRDEAILEGARRNLARYEVLAAQDSIARQTVEDQQATVKQDEGVVLIDKGAVSAAQVNLGRTRITSPMDGRAGVRLVDPGNLVGAGSVATSTNGAGASGTSASSAGGASGQAGASGSITGGVTGSGGIVVINQIDPIAVTFTVPQNQFQTLLQVSNGFRRPLLTQAFTQDANEMLGQGELRIADNKVDPSTGTVQLKARFANAGARMWPGQYVNVRLVLQTLQHVLTVPVAAIQEGPKGSYVYIVSGGRAQQRAVQVTTTQGGMAVIASGLGLGETVIVDGQMTLHSGSQVRLPGQPAPHEGGEGGGGASRRRSGR